MCEKPRAMPRNDRKEEDVFLRLRETAELVMHDLQGDAVTTHPTLDFSGPDASGLVIVLLTESSGAARGFGVQVSGTSQEVLYTMADRIPEVYVDLYAVGLPLVPGTQRPAVPRVAGEQVVWLDPKGESAWSCPIGRYGQNDAD
ncbi:hypothetical protein ACFO3J_11535 [Streptomyces polygonati]|uniref:Uncharacterized protein n=1 Tax=Streptomyces polygonati TaxID=1617087 RepID=A0ABV8HPP1_9ACTN